MLAVWLLSFVDSSRQQREALRRLFNKQGEGSTCLIVFLLFWLFVVGCLAVGCWREEEGATGPGEAGDAVAATDWRGRQ